MLKYLIKRILWGIPVLFAILVVTFALSHAMPGGPFSASGQRRLPPHVTAQLESKFGLDKPVFFNLPYDGKGPDVARGTTIVIKGHADSGFETTTQEAEKNAGIRLYGQYHLIEAENSTSCLGLPSEKGWALIARREKCVVTGGNQNQTFTHIESYWSLDLFNAQFWIYLGNVARLDFGPSLNLTKIQENKQVTDDFKERIPVSMQLGIFSVIMGFSLGIPLGVIAALNHNTYVDYTATFFAVLGQAIPAIVLGPILILVIGIQFDIIPAEKIINPQIWKQDNYLSFAFLKTLFSRDYISVIILPVLTIGTGMSAGIARLTRATLLQVLNEDYIRTARAKGLQENRVIYLHALKNALIPVVTSLGPVLAGIVSGSFIIEQIFSIPGMGKTFIEAVAGRDYTTIMGATLFFSTILIAGNIFVDVLYTWLDPRIRLE